MKGRIIIRTPERTIQKTADLEELTLWYKETKMKFLPYSFLRRYASLYLFIDGKWVRETMGNLARTLDSWVKRSNLT